MHSNFVHLLKKFRLINNKNEIEFLKLKLIFWKIKNKKFLILKYWK